MKQVLQDLRTGKTELAEVPVPGPRPGAVLVRVAASLVSAGTERTLVAFAERSLLGKARSRPDLVRQILDKARREGVITTIEAAFNRLDQPIPLGYSSAGTIISQGEDIQDVRTGMRVACAGGGYAVHAEYNVVPRQLIAPLPDQVDFESAAFVTLGAIALHGYHLSEARLGERVAVIGLGVLGLLAVQIAKAGGCQVLGVDLDARRVEKAVNLGAEAVLRDRAENAALSFSRGLGYDAILICADTPSNDPVTLAGAIARDRARVIALGAVGLDIPRKVYYEKELTFLVSRSYGPGRYDPGYEEAGHDYPIGFVRWTEGRNLEAFVDLLATGQVDVHPLITHRFPIEHAAEAYELITGKRDEPYLGVMLTYPPAIMVSAGADSVGASLQPHVGQPIIRCKLGVIGAGNFAANVLLPAIKKIPEIELVGIASASGLSAQHAANRYGFHFATSSDKKIIQDSDINTVAVVTRHHLHARYVIEALAAGKHVFCEKPLAIKEDELREIETALASIADSNHLASNEGNSINLTQTNKIIPLLMVGFNRRFAPLAKRLQAFLEGRNEPVYIHYRVNAGYLPLNHWLHDPDQGGGRIIGEGCHFIDVLTFLAGAPPVAVSVQALPDSGRYREDNVSLTLAFPDGSLGTIAYLANGDRAFTKERIEVFCGGRVAVLDDFRSLEMIVNGERRTIRSRLRQNKGHRGEWEAFSAAIASGGLPPIPYSQIFGVTRATFASVVSLRSGEKITINSNI